MIVLFEGPSMVGKTTMIKKVEDTLKSWDFPVQRYDTVHSDEENVVGDLSNVLDEKLFSEDQIWLVDTFHFYPWVYAKAKKAVSYGGSDWMLFEAGLKKIDERLAEEKALFLLITTPPWTLDIRFKKTGRKDPTGDGKKAQYWWLNSMHKTDCEMIHFVNDKTKHLDRLCFLIADIITVRWSRMKPSAEPSLVEIAETELEAEVKEVKEDEDENRDAPMGPGIVEPGPELSGGKPVDEESMDIPF